MVMSFKSSQCSLVRHRRSIFGFVQKCPHKNAIIFPYFPYDLMAMLWYSQSFGDFLPVFIHFKDHPPHVEVSENGTVPKKNPKSSDFHKMFIRFSIRNHPF